MKQRLLIVGSLLAFSILIGLGTWQYQRLQWKEGLLADIAERTAMEPIPLETALAMRIARDALEYRPVSVTATIIPDSAQFVLATQDGASGWHVYEPFQIANEAVVIVNRGFIPYDAREDDTWFAGNAQITMTGLFRNPLSEKPSFIVPENTPDDRTFYWKDLAAMADAMALEGREVLPVFVDLQSPVPESGLPIPGVTRIDLPNNHLQYMLTWWGLALTLVIVLGIYVVKLRRSQRAADG